MSELVKPLSTIADINPLVSIAGLPDDYQVTFIGMADVSEAGRIITKHYKELQDVKIGFTRFLEGDVLFAKITPCMENGKGGIAIGLTNNIGFGSTEFHVLRSKKNIGDTGYIHQIIQSSDFRLKAEAKMTGSAGQKRVPQEFVINYRVFIPNTLDEQHKIATILSTVDDVIEKTEAAIEKYKAIKAGMMQDLFTRGIDVKTGKLRPSYEAPELYKETELGRIPKEWAVYTIKDACLEFINGGTPSTKNTANWIGTIPWITGADFLDSFEVGAIRRYINDDALKNSSSHLIRKGNILLVTRTGVGKLAITPFDVAISQDITGLILNPDNYCVEFFYYYLQILVEDFKKVNQGTSINGIIRSDLEATLILKPSLDEQKQIAAVIKALDKTLKKEQSNLIKYCDLKMGLMADLLTGKVRVNQNENIMENG